MQVVVEVPFALGNGEPIFHVVGCRALDVASVVEERESPVALEVRTAAPWT